MVKSPSRAESSFQMNWCTTQQQCLRIPHLEVVLPQITTPTVPPLNTEIKLNKTIFYLLSHHKELFGVSASWNFFEADHGKCPCDGVGGSVKRMADEVVRQQKVTTQDASDFFAWTQQHQSSSSVSLFPRRPVMHLNQKLRDLES